MVSRVIPVTSFDLVIFGATGDLAKRKIFPGLFRRFLAGQMPKDSQIVGAARSSLSIKTFNDLVENSIKNFIEINYHQEDLKNFLKCINYVQIDATGTNGWNELKKALRPKKTRAFYFSVSPSLFGSLAERLHNYEITTKNSRIVVEKPFGRDLKTAKELNAILAEHFTEEQIYRIDHYLGKETVQNLMAIRFGNMLFEPLWNAQYVDHIQITVSETVGVGDRGEYYDESGAMRDMVQNHLMQLLCLIAMEPPARFEPDSVRDEKLKVIRALDPVAPHHIVRGQYGPGNEHADYRTGVQNPKSKTESFVALKVNISNYRWAGVPFYLRTGKRLKARTSEIAVVFKEKPHSIFGPEAGNHQNALIIRLQPDEGITMDVTIKEPGPGGMRLIDVPLDMTFSETLGIDENTVPDAYERLIMDVIRGNQTLFMRGDEVEAAWAWTDPIINGWIERNDVPKPYESGSSGPQDSLTLLEREGRNWRQIL
ncbi:MAG: glucose-6-phosphate dehydrogenase [Paracoccaceae bacterium]|nr:MAG: glucose-6-phosphate 1-dehydrogenase [Rhodobacterales bacterium]